MSDPVPNFSTLPGIPSDLITEDPVGERRWKVDAEVTVPPVQVDNVGIKDTGGDQIDPATKQEQIRLYDAFDLYQQAFIDEDFATESTLLDVKDTLADILLGQLADNHQVTVSNFPSTQTVDGTVDVGNFPTSYPLPQSQVDALKQRNLDKTTDNVEVCQLNHDNLNANANLQIGDADVNETNQVTVKQTALTLTTPDKVTVGSASGPLLAAGTASALRPILVSVPTTAVGGIHIAVGGAATTNKFLVEAGGVLTINTGQAINAIRAGLVDVDVYLIHGVAV